MNPPDLAQQLAVLPAFIGDLDTAQQLAQRLGITCLTAAQSAADISEWPMVLLCNAEGLAVQPTGAKAAGAVKVDFLAGAVAHRRRFGGGQGQQIAKAVGVSSGIRPSVLDATAGLGRDAFVLATLGCEVTLLERSGVVAALLADGLQRAQADVEVAQIVARMRLLEQSAHAYLSSQLELRAEKSTRPQVVFLDPMFPERTKSAAVKKEMLLFKALVGQDEDADGLLNLALQVASHRVVVKRPKQAPFLAGKTPSYQLTGKSGRFDVYALKKLT